MVEMELSREAFAERRAAHNRRRRGGRARQQLAYHIALAVVVFLFVAPFYYVLVASMKPGSEVFAYPPNLVPWPIDLTNYAHLLAQTSFLRWMANTLLVAVSVTTTKLFLDSMAAYALAKIDFTGKRLVFVAMLMTLMVPGGVLIIPLWSVMNSLGLLNTYAALILPPLASPFGTILLRQFILGLPRDLDNAARLDGLSEWGIYWHIVLPLIRPGLVVLGVIIFTDQFMSFLWPLIATTDDSMTMLTVGVAAMRAHGGIDYGQWSAAAILSLLPIAIVFFVMQRQFLSQSLAGALKQ
jgi:multiple sugar transport system permease protein